jgi:toxin FitB
VIVLDTNVLSELMRPEPSEAVLLWVAALPPSNLFTTTVSEAEIRYGAALLPPGRRWAALLSAAESAFSADFAGRVLAFDRAAAREFAENAADHRRGGRPIGLLDMQIAAIARAHGAAAVATRNVAHFEGHGFEVLDPWTGRRS